MCTSIQKYLQFALWLIKSDAIQTYLVVPWDPKHVSEIQCPSPVQSQEPHMVGSSFWHAKFFVTRDLQDHSEKKFNSICDSGLLSSINVDEYPIFYDSGKLVQNAESQESWIWGWCGRQASRGLDCTKINTDRTSLVVQWLGIHLPTQGTRVRALVWEDPTCRGATKPISHNYWSPCA